MYEPFEIGEVVWFKWAPGRFARGKVVGMVEPGMVAVSNDDGTSAVGIPVEYCRKGLAEQPPRGKPTYDDNEADVVLRVQPTA